MNPFSALTSKIYGSVAVAALLFALVQTARIEGFLFIDGYRDKLARRDEQIVQINRTSVENLAAQKAQVRAMEARFTMQAKEAQTAYDQAIANVRPAVVRYIDRNRLHEDGLCRRPADPAGEAPNPGLPAQVPPDTGMVAIRDDDLQALVEWATVGIAEHNRAVSKIDDGTAEAVKAGVPDPAFGD